MPQAYAAPVVIDSQNEDLFQFSGFGNLFCARDESNSLIIGKIRERKKDGVVLFKAQSKAKLASRFRKCKAKQGIEKCGKQKEQLKDFQKAKKNCSRLFDDTTPNPSSSPTPEPSPSSSPGSSPDPSPSQSPEPSPSAGGNNTAPSANAGEDQRVIAGAMITLDGSQSSDPENDALSFTWTLRHKPFHSAAALVGANTPNPSFVADMTATYHIDLVVNDGQLSSTQDTVIIMAGNVIQVGPGRTFEKPSEALQVANDGDTIEIDAGEYLGDVSNVDPDNLVIRGVGGRAHLRANGQHQGGKAIWVIRGDNVTVESIEFSEASVPDENGAGIRQEGTDLTVTNCKFHNNENGILAGTKAGSDIVIEYSEFGGNGFGTGFSHNLYINQVDSLTFRCNYTHHSNQGHLLKTRAHKNFVLYNRIMDETTGNSSYAVDFSNGGQSYLIGNLIQQGSNSPNSGIISYAAEGYDSRPNSERELYVVNNTLVNEKSNGTFVQIFNPASAAVIMNNIFVGNGTLVNGTASQMTNLHNPLPGLVSPSTYDYFLSAGSPAINSATNPGVVNGFDLMPDSHYVHEAGCIARPVQGALDIGALEYTP